MNLHHNEGGSSAVQPESDNRAFNGVWIPASLWTRTDLTWFQKCLIAEISSFKECFASNEYIAKMMQSTEGCIAKEISKLRKKGLILDMGFDGRKRFIVVAREVHPNPFGITERSTQGLPSGKGCLPYTVNIDTSVEQRRVTKQSKESAVRTVRVSSEERDRLLREVVQIPPNAPDDKELAEIIFRFPVVKKWRGDMFWHLKGTKFHVWKRNRWEPIKSVPSFLDGLEKKFIKQGKTA